MRFICIFIIFLIAKVNFAQTPQSLIKIKIDPKSYTINVINLSSGGNLYIINFGDGTIIQGEKPENYTHTYASAGTYTITMITLFLTSNTETIGDTINEVVVIPEYECKCDFEVQTNKLAIQLINKSTGDYSKSTWIIEGIKKIVSQNAEIVLPSSGHYNIRLRIEGKICTKEKDTIILVRSDTLSAIAYWEYQILNDNTVNFFNKSLGKWTFIQWNFGDGNKSTESNPIHVYQHPGNYVVSLFLIDSLTQLVSHYETKIKVGNVKELILPEFEAETFSDTNLVIFHNTSLASENCTFLWTLGDGNMSSDREPVHIYSTSGHYNVCLNVFSGSLRYTTCNVISVGKEDFPLIFDYIVQSERKVIFNPLLHSVPDEIIWDFGDKNQSTQIRPTYTYKKKDIYWVKLKVRWGTQWQEAYQIINLTDNPSKLRVLFDFSKERLKADNKRIRYRGGLTGDVSRIRFEWNFGDGTMDTLEISPLHNYLNDSIYTVCLKVYNDLTGDSDRYCQSIKIGQVNIASKPKEEIDLLVYKKNENIQVIINSKISDYIIVDIFDMMGRKIKTIYKGRINAGEYTYYFPSIKGVYLIVLKTNNGVLSKKVFVY